jgi:hypothetical protein
MGYLICLAEQKRSLRALYAAAADLADLSPLAL